MTIAACYVGSEGVILGADSTTTIAIKNGRSYTFHHYTFGQKIFEFGKCGATAGIVTWGLGALGKLSYRTLAAEVSDRVEHQNCTGLKDVAGMWASAFWNAYSECYREVLISVKELEAKGNRTPEEEDIFQSYCDNYTVGFCLGGWWHKDRHPLAYEIVFDPLLEEPPEPVALIAGVPKYWGMPNLIERLILGIDPQLYCQIMDSGKWAGTDDELLGIIQPGVLSSPPDLPIREAIDLVHANIYTTIKAMKFSSLAPVCGGPIEIAVITSDRPFRWVCHKEMGDAICEGWFGRE